MAMILRWALATNAAAIVAALAAQLTLRRGGFSLSGFEDIVLGSLLHALLLGLPTAAILARFNKASAPALMAAGFVIGAAPFIVISMFLNPFSGIGNAHGVIMLGLLGGLGGLTFWVCAFAWDDRR